VIVDAVLARWPALLWLGGWWALGASLSDDAGMGVIPSSCHCTITVNAGDVGGHITAVNTGGGGGVIVVVVVVSVDGHGDDVDSGGHRHRWPPRQRWWWGRRCPRVGGGAVAVA